LWSSRAAGLKYSTFLCRMLEASEQKGRWRECHDIHPYIAAHTCPSPLSPSSYLQYNAYLQRIRYECCSSEAWPSNHALWMLADRPGCCCAEPRHLRRRFEKQQRRSSNQLIYLDRNPFRPWSHLFLCSFVYCV
jgi:hypothetical protein